MLRPIAVPSLFFHFHHFLHTTLPYDFTMKYLTTLVLGLFLSFSTLNSALFPSQMTGAEAVPVEISLEQTDSSDLNDPHDKPSLHLNRFKYTSFFKTTPSHHIPTRYPYEIIFFLLKPPDFTLFS